MSPREGAQVFVALQIRGVGAPTTSRINRRGIGLGREWMKESIAEDVRGQARHKKPVKITGGGRVGQEGAWDL